MTQPHCCKYLGNKICLNYCVKKYHVHFRISYTMKAEDIFRSSIGCEIMLMIKARIRLFFSRYTIVLLLEVYGGFFKMLLKEQLTLQSMVGSCRVSNPLEMIWLSSLPARIKSI